MGFDASIEGFLLAMAQIAVAFAGFAGVIGAFSRFTTDARAVTFRVRAMVALSLHALLMAIAPFALAAFDLAPEAAWRVACGYAALQAIIVSAALVMQGMPIFREKLLRTAYLNLAWNLIGAVVIGFLGAVTIALLSADIAPRLYVAAIAYVVFLCAYNFLMLIFSIDFRP